jgi:hypothetical protein
LQIWADGWRIAGPSQPSLAYVVTTLFFVCTGVLSNVSSIQSGTKLPPRSLVRILQENTPSTINYQPVLVLYV